MDIIRQDREWTVHMLGINSTSKHTKKHEISANAVKLSNLNAFKNGTETLLHKIFAFGSILFTFAAIKLLMTQIEGLQLNVGLTSVRS